MSDCITLTVPKQIAREIKNTAKQFEFYIQRNDNLIQEFYKIGYTQEKIGKILGITNAAVSMQYPHKKGVSK